jgi:hypothetical protein
MARRQGADFGARGGNTGLDAGIATRLDAGRFAEGDLAVGEAIEMPRQAGGAQQHAEPVAIPRWCAAQHRRRFEQRQHAGAHGVVPLALRH